IAKVVESGALYSSGGCLVGSIYATPLYPHGDVFRVHNLGEYIYKTEAPRASYLQVNSKVPEIMILEVSLPDRAHDNLIGIDYTRLGGAHFAIYKELEYLLSMRERIYLQEIIVNRIKQALSLLNLVNCYYKGDCKEVNFDHFFNLYVDAIDQLPILGYLYFEVIAEYFMLFEDTKAAKSVHELGEIHNEGYKNIMFDLFPELLKGAGLGCFKPTPAQVVQYVKTRKLISGFNKKSFLEYLMKRTIYMVQSRLMSGNNKDTDWRNLRWDIETLQTISSPLLGHLVHRELRNFGRFPDFYFYFDQFKALQAWNYWNQMGIIIPFNGVMPKGEIGVNPAIPDLDIKVYIGRETKGSRVGNMLVEIDKEVDAKVVPRLIDHRVSLMRSRAKKEMKDLAGTFRD
ncbi:hypothetical protein ACFLZ9_00565, partial [Patescibacteria group bacterium]